MAIKPTTRKQGQDYAVPNTVYKWNYHAGEDYPAPVGDPIKAPLAGDFKFLSGDNGGYGHVAQVKTRFGFVHWMTHASNRVGKDRRVKQGEIVARSGNTGYSTGAHIHWEVRWQGKDLDPSLWLWMERKFESYEKTIATQKSQLASQAKKIANYQKAIKEMQSIINGLSTTTEVTAMKTKLTQLQADLDKANNQLADEDRIVSKIINAIKEFFNGTN